MVAPKKTIYPKTDGRVVLRSIPWNMYENLLAANQDQAGIRFYYDNGILEIKMPSLRHENPNRKLARLIEVLAEEMNLDIEPAGSTTFKREDLRKGFEPDSCYYIQHAKAIRGKETIDLSIDPAPDLVIEIDISSDSLDKFPIFADLGVPEVWRFDGEKVIFYTLMGAEYAETETSRTFPSLTIATATRFLEESSQKDSIQWLQDVRGWIRSQLVSEQPR